MIQLKLCVPNRLLTFKIVYAKVFSIMSDRSQRNKEAYLEKLDEVQDRFEREGIESRVIGSLAVHGHLATAGVEFRELDFDRPGSYTADQRVPDIDLIVPREHLETSSRIRTEALSGKQPVKLGLAIPTSTIDYRPYSDVSELQCKDISVEFPSQLFDVHEVEYHGHAIRTLGATALLHTFVTAGGIARHKDLAMMREMIKLSNSEPDRQHDQYDPFHNFISQRNHKYPNVRLQSRLTEGIFGQMSPAVKNRTMHQALKVADWLKLR